MEGISSEPVRWYLIVLFLSTTTCIQQCAAQGSGLDPAVRDYIDTTIRDVFFPIAKIDKMTLAIVQNDGEILYTTGYGLANIEKNIQNNNDTQFLIGSVTKSFTSVVVAKALQEAFPEMGESVMDTPINILIPSANFTLIDRFRSQHATFRDLLSHRMCIFRDDMQLIALPFTNRSEIVYRQRYAKEICGIRTEFQYNNQMYVIASELIGQIAKRSYDELFQDLLTSLGMNNSRMVMESDDFASMLDRAQPYYVMNGTSHPVNPELVKRVALNAPAGGLFTTANDMSRYMRFHLNKGSLDGKQIVPENVMQWLVKPATVVPMMRYKASDEDLILNTYGYGTGLFLGAYDGWQIIEHGGDFPPYSTQMSLFPEKKLGIFSSANEGPLYANRLNLHAFIFEVLRGTYNISEPFNPKNWIKNADEKAEKLITHKKTMAKFIRENRGGYKVTAEEIVGMYGSGGSGDVEVSEKLNNETNTMGLYFSYGKWSKGWIVETESSSIYKVYWDTDAVQDNYAGGNPDKFGYVRIENGKLDIIAIDPNNNVYEMSTFTLGVSLDNLPPIPWDSNSC